MSNARHHEALVKTANIVALAKQGLQAGTSGDFIWARLQEIFQQMIYWLISLASFVLGSNSIKINQENAELDQVLKVVSKPLWFQNPLFQLTIPVNLQHTLKI